LLTPQVFKGSAVTVPVGSRAPISVTIARGAADSITKETTVNTPLVAPIAAGATVGQYTVRVGDEVVARVPLVALEQVEEGGLWRWAVDSVMLWFED
jgi:D-alanyl-D-alanine carboxypeptidase (penicillin-binding protein 5/6)